MNWTFWFVLAALALIAFIAAAVCVGLRSRGRANRVVTPFNLVLVGVMFTILFLLIPVYGSGCEGTQQKKLNTAMYAVYGTIQVFTLEFAPELIAESVGESVGKLAPAYSAALSVLVMAAPFFTFGFVLSFFRSASDRLRLFLQLLFFRRKNVYIFSDLNEKSLALADSIGKKDKYRKSILIFTDVSAERKNGTDGLAVEKLNGFCHRKEITDIKLRFYSGRRRSLCLFVISDDQMKNMIQAKTLTERYGGIQHSWLYVFSAGIEGELLLSQLMPKPVKEKAEQRTEKGEADEHHVEKDEVNEQQTRPNDEKDSANQQPEDKSGKQKTADDRMKVRRVNEVQSLIYHLLYQDGPRLFKDAEKYGGNIHAVIVGLGRYGTEMLKALTWYCQMDGFHITIDAFDRDPLAEERIAAACPELLSPAHNGYYEDGEAEYTIRIHSGIDVGAVQFYNSILKLKKVTYAVTALGSDAENLKAAADLRMLFTQSGYSPRIQAVVYQSDIREMMKDAADQKDQQNAIECIGDLATLYSEDSIINSELTEDARQRHMNYKKLHTPDDKSDDDFWQSEYNQKSSMAVAIHKKARRMGYGPKIEEKDARMKQEHRRWNAYMRGEGYAFAAKRDDLAKKHDCLVPWDQLSDENKKLDQLVIND